MTYVKIRGVEDVNRVLRLVGPREAKNLLRSTVTEIAKRLATDIKARSPDDTGVLDKETRHKRGKGSRTRIEAQVTIGSKAFYWRFLEYGQGPDGIEHAFVLGALQALRPEMDRVYLEVFASKLVARINRELKRRGG